MSIIFQPFAGCCRAAPAALAAGLLAMLAIPAAPLSAATITVTMKGMDYQPADIKAHVGDTIMWVNKDPVDHTATDRKTKGHVFNVQLPAGKTVRQKLTRAGSFPYYCTFHPNMTGTLTVSPAPAAK